MEHLLDVQNLCVAFRGDDHRERTVVDHVSFQVNPGEILCIVGESGCGKSVTSLAIMNLLSRNGHITEGTVLFDGQDLTKLSAKELDKIRGSKMTMIFQDALTSLNPVFTVGKQVMESLRIHLGMAKDESVKRAVELLEKVGLPDPETMMRKYPHQLSGGQRQRVMIAIALSCNPKLLIADEPTTALDVTIQSQIMALTKNLIHELNMSMILITHDLGLVAEMADRVMVMYAGQIVETADVYTLFRSPAHPYTRALLGAVPSIYDEPDRQLVSIRGTVPENYEFLTGCRFADRCDSVCDNCREAAAGKTMYSAGENHSVRCILFSADNTRPNTSGHCTSCKEEVTSHD
ncbi:MAG: ABC transporter ATP-binding protein [Lachnospiraceae bacterium]|nr:ABC transporter ATP-binding protein [Lachnospiraceae bacterium]